MKKLAILLCATAAFGSGSAAQAVNLVTNGDFESTTNGPGQLWAGYTALTGWTAVDGFNFVFAAGTLDTTGSYSSQYNGNLTLWGANNGGIGAPPATSPAGGNFVVNDGAFETTALQQTITGLTPGSKYAVRFYWAAGQQSGFTGNTTEGWRVSLGAQTLDTAIVTNPSHDFQAWRPTTLTFTAANTTEVLSFLALGTPEGLPPFSLLDGVSLSAVPEPSSWMMLITGFAFVGAAARRRNRTVAA